MISCLSLVAVELLDAGACRAWWLRRLHPAGPVCPSCKVAVQGRRAETWSNGGRLHCKSCGKWFDNRTGTPVDTCRADWRQLTVIASLLPAGVAVPIVAQICKLSQHTVRNAAERLLLEARS